MRESLSLTAVAVALLVSGCSGSSNSASSGGASPAPAPAATFLTDKRSGLAIYPDATAGNYSDGNPAYTLYISSDDMAKVGAWYKTNLPAAFVENKSPANFSSPYDVFDNTTGKELKVGLSPMPDGKKTRIELDRYK